ncbi:MAG TPA: MFS transporter [Candidatus Binatia bacterium]|nr:MFS transporter [Candidatus Binatia bacterium]
MALFQRGRASLSRTLSSLRYRNYRLLFLGTSLSHVGDFVQAMAQSWLVWTMTGSPFLLGLVGFCQALPRLLLGVIGGAIVDRVERRRLLIATQILAMAQAFSFWALVYFDVIEFWHVLVLVLLLGTVNTLNQTARHSLINGLVPREHLMNAIALNSSLANLAKVVGPSLGGVLITIIGVAGCLLVNAVSFLAIIVTLVIMEFPVVAAETKEGASFWHEVAEGFYFVRGQQRLFSVILLTYAVALVGSPYTRFLPIFATDILHAGPSTFGLLLAAPGAGAVLAGLGIASLSMVHRRMHFVAMSVYAFSLSLVLFAFSRSLPLSMLFLVLVGASNIAIRAVANGIVQMETPPHLLGRVLSLFFMDKGLWSFGTLFIGTVAHWFGTAPAIAISGIACALAASALLYQQRQGREILSVQNLDGEVSQESRGILRRQ